jgi:hypothetical protein
MNLRITQLFIYCFLVALVLTIFITNIQPVKAATVTTVAYAFVSPDGTGPNMMVSIGCVVYPIPPSGTKFHNLSYTIFCPNGTQIKRFIPIASNTYSDGNFFFDSFSTSTIISSRDTYTLNFTYPGETINGVNYSSCSSDSKSFFISNQGFSIGASSSQTSIKRGDSVSYVLSLFGWGDVNSPVDLDYPTDLPTGTTLIAFPSKLYPGDPVSGILKIKTSSSTPTNVYDVHFKAIRETDGFQYYGFVQFLVMDFSISASPLKQYIKPGDTAKFSINFNSNLWQELDGNVTLSTPRYTQELTLTPVPNTIGFSFASPSPKANLTISTISSTPIGLYNIDVIGTSGNLTHLTTVQLAVGKEMSVTCTPQNSTVDTEGIANFNVDVTDGIAPYTYQWYDNQGSLPGKNSKSLSIKESIGDHTYYCIVTDAGGQTKESNRVTLTVSPKSDLLVVHGTVDSNIIEMNQTATISLDVLTGGKTPYGYKWLDKDTSAIMGLNQSLVINKDKVGNYTYYCIVTDFDGQTKESNLVTITVTSIIPKLIAHVTTGSSIVPLNQKATLTLDVLVGGVPPYHYQWFEDGVGVVGIDREFVLNKDVTGNYSYYCLITDDSGQTLQSNKVTLTVVSGSDFWVSLLPYLVFVIIAVIIIVIIIQRRKKLKKEIESLPLNPMEEWQYFECPTSGMKPGTVFRVTKDKKVEKVVTLEPPKYNIEIEEEDEVLGEIDRNIKASTFIGFTGLGVADLGGKLSNTQTFALDLPGLKKESTNDFNLIGLENKLIGSKTFALIFQDDDRYFIITKARKAKQIKYVLNNTQVNNFGGEAKVKELALRGKHLNFEKGDRSINQAFDEYMRVAFYAKQLNLKRDKNGKIVRKS